MQARRQEVAGGQLPPMVFVFVCLFVLVSSVTYGDDDNTPTPFCHFAPPPKQTPNAAPE